MATNGEFITDALRKIGVLAETESASADQGASGLRIMNDMIAEMFGDDVDIGYAPQSDTTANCPIALEYRQPIKYLLAVHLCAIYERPVSPVVGDMASKGYDKMLRDMLVQTMEVSTMTHLPVGSAFRRTFSIINGDY